MTRGISIHIGLNAVDANAYQGWDGKLVACENDAHSMEAIASSFGYKTNILLTADATSAAVCEEIGKAAQELVSGDHLLLTYSGHGGQVPDTNGDEDDGQDETWVLYDRMLCDDELYAMWSHFAAGVKIFVLSDSCHSGTVVRAMLRSFALRSQPAPSRKEIFYGQLADESNRKKAPGLPAASRFKAIPGVTQARVWQKSEPMYRTVQWIAGKPKDNPIGATILLISGCQDNQFSQDGDKNGLFTEKLLQVWSDGSFSGGHHDFYQQIGGLMPPTQTPNYLVVGSADSTFEGSRPFALEAGGASSDASSHTSTEGTADSANAAESGTTTDDAAGTAPGTPSVVCDSESVTADEPPSFTIDLAGNPYYVFEIADDESAFNSPPDSNGDHYYGTWADPDQPGRSTDRRFTIPSDVWSKLAATATTLYYRVCTTSSAETDKWENYHTSTANSLTIGGAERGLPARPSFVSAR